MSLLYNLNGQISTLIQIQDCDYTKKYTMKQKNIWEKIWIGHIFESHADFEKLYSEMGLGEKNNCLLQYLSMQEKQIHKIHQNMFLLKWKQIATECLEVDRY